MSYEAGAIELRDQGAGGAIAERNEEINRRRLAGGGGSSGPLRVTDPAALARLMSEMKAKAEQQRAAEDAREAERKQREGAAYRTPEQRAEAARAARQAAAEARAEGEEAQVLEKRLDPSRDYYQLLGLPRGASSADIRKAYKKLALLYHPDKHKASDAEQQAAIQDKFKQMVEAFDVLSNEEQRRVYDKVRDYQDANPGRGLPVLSPEEAALMRSGIAELSRLRRMGAKATKHPVLEKEVYVSLAKLNAGCTKTVAVERRRVRPDGIAFLSTKNIHVIIRRGSPEGDRLVFEGDGEESVDTLPGDLLLVLRAKPHPLFRRSGLKDLELFGGSLGRGEVLFALDVPTLRGARRLIAGSAFRAAAANGGAGGVWQTELAGHGLYDTVEPWEQPPGCLRVQLRYPSCLLEEAAIAGCLRPQSVHLLGSSSDVVSASLAAGVMAGLLCHKLEAQEMVAEEQGQTGACGSTSRCTARHEWGDEPPRSGNSSSRQSSCGTGNLRSAGACSDAVLGSKGSAAGRPRAVCLVVTPMGHPGPSGPPSDVLHCLPDDSSSGSSNESSPSAGAAAMLRALQLRVPGLQASVAMSDSLLDEDWLALSQADILILDWWQPDAEGDAVGGARCASGDTDKVTEVQRRLREAGLLELLWQRFWAGCLLAGLGQGCSLLGLQAGGCSGGGGRSSEASSGTLSVLPWYLIRAGGGTAGWAALHRALHLSAAAEPACTPALACVGVMAGGCWQVDPSTGRAEMVVAPSRETLVSTAAWTAGAGNSPAALGLQEAEDADWGYFCELSVEM